MVCQVNGQSDEMYILLNGQLGVCSEGQMLLANIDPVAPVGEMDLITGQPRSATVSALCDSNLLGLRKATFDRLMRSNGKLCVQGYRSVIEAMGQRLDESRADGQRVVLRRTELEGKRGELVEEAATGNGLEKD